MKTTKTKKYYVVIWDNYYGDGYVAESTNPEEYPHNWHYDTKEDATMALNRRYCD